MFLTELAERQLIVIYPGRFQPSHKGHAGVFQKLAGKFGRNNTYIATSGKTGDERHPFSFSEKLYFMQLQGIPTDRIIESSQPYRIENILETGRISVASPENTVVVFAVSEKDMAEDPRFKTWTKKDGNPTYFQPYPADESSLASMKEHAYILTVKVLDFPVLGQNITSASDIRKMYAEADNKTRQQLIADVFGKYTPEAEKILTARLSPVAEQKAAPLAKTTKLQPVKVAEDREDPKRYKLLTKARIAHPTAKSPEEALALYIADIEHEDFTNVEREEQGLENQVKVLANKVNRLDAEVQQLSKQGSLKEFAPGGDEGDDGFSEETLKMLAAQWYNGDEDPRVERTLMAAGWEIGQDEGYDDEPGVFVVQSGDTNGDSYLSWSAHELKQSVAEGANEFILYVNNEPAAKYTNVEDARLMRDNLKKKYPSAKIELKQEKCDLISIKEQGVVEGEGDPDGLPHLTPELASHISDQIDTEGPHAVEKSINWGDGAAEELLARIKEMLDDYAGTVEETAAWQKKSGKNKNGGLNDKGIASYRREHPGSKLQKAVTTKPSKLKKGSKAAKRRKSFCARMGGMKGPMKDEHGKPTRKALALRKWNCESVEQFEQMIESHFEQVEMLNEAVKQRLDPKCWTGYHKAGTKIKGGVRVNNCVPNESVDEGESRRGGSPLWTFMEVADKLGIPVSALNLLAFSIIKGFPEAVPEVSSRYGSKRYYDQNEVKRWVRENNVRERIAAYKAKRKGVAEEAAGVGVVKGSKDPRYSMATTGDQNDVTGDTLDNELKAYHLKEYTDFVTKFQ